MNFFSKIGDWFWVLAFTLFCIIFLEQTIKLKDTEYSELLSMKITLENQISREVSIQDDLTHEINSQSDPAWVELTLMKELGLAPEGQRKIVFVPKRDIPPKDSG